MEGSGLRRRKLWGLLFIIICGAVFTANVAETIPGTCQADYDYYGEGNRCYKIYDDKKSWQNARAACHNEQADLAMVFDEHTSDFVRAHVKKHSMLGKSVWFGLFETAYHKYRWIDNNPLVFQEWGDGEPNNQDRNIRECVQFVVTLTTEEQVWSDAYCSKDEHYICEKSPEIYPVCHSGFAAYPDDGKCVKVVRDRNLGWNAARLDCQSQGGDLVTIRDESYLDFINKILKGISNQFWIGLWTFENGSDVDKFYWVDGSSLGYANWLPGEPNGGVTVRCVEAFAKPEWPLPKWNDQNCDVQIPYICEHRNRVAPICPGIGWTLHRQTNKCYKLQTVSRTFKASREKCLSEGGDLVVIPDTQTRDYVISLIAPTIATRTRYWIGLTSPDKDTHFEWLDGTPLDRTLPIAFSHLPDEHWASIQFNRGSYRYSDREGYQTMPSICHKTVSRDYPILECPRGYTTYVTTTLANRWRVTCLMSQNNHRKSYSDAKKECRDDGGDLYNAEEGMADRDVFMVDTLMVFGTSYWYDNELCMTFGIPLGLTQGNCTQLHHYMCAQPGNIASLVDLRKLRRIDQAVYAIQDGSLPKACVADVCQASNLTDLYRRHGWTKSTTHASIVTDTDLSVLIKEYRDNRLLYHTEEHECRIEARLTPLQDETFSPRLRVTFPVEKLLCLCLDPNIVGLHDTNVCPGKLPQGSIDILNQATTPKNGSAAPNKLCPCRCSSGNIDFNPSPRVLAGIISKIQKELKVDREQLSLKRSKKISSPDSRTESQAIGYLGVLLCLIPFGLLIAADLVRVFQFMTSP